MADPKPKKRRKYVRAIGPKLNRLLWVVFGLFAVLGINAVYLSSITILEWWTQQTYENYFYLQMFFAHLILGLLIVVPVIVFGLVHMRNTYDRKNRRAVRVGYALFAASLILLFSGIVLTRVEGLIDVRDPAIRSFAYWAHVITPLLCVWLFILHRLAGRKIKWKIGFAWAAVACVLALGMIAFHSQDPKSWNVAGPESGEQYFFPSLARTSDGNFIDGAALQNDAYCKECHPETHAEWENSVHKWASFNNPAYLASVRDTRAAMMERDGNVQGARFCAGCHDPVPFFSGAFDDPDFDDVNHSTAQAGITCTVCHSITHVNSPKGNADYTIEAPSHYPFAFSDNAALSWINKQLIKAKPDFHKKTFLKPLHKSPEFCGTCHKVHLPVELNHYKWLRGQNHYDPYHLSGVSGHGAQSFYYPPKAVHNCNECHMKLEPSTEFGVADFDGSGELKRHNHMFPSANTAIPYLVGRPESVIAAHEEFNEGVMRVDLFGVKKGGGIDDELEAPLGDVVPVLEPGEDYLVEAIIRTVKMGHLFTQGTADSNEVWLEATAKLGDQIVGRIGGMEADGTLDPWAHRVNAFVIDREGFRIAKRNAEDIFLALYNHQIPPGAADVVHLKLQVPEAASGELTIDIALKYRKFDTEYMRFFQGDEFDGNDLPVMTLATDSFTFPVGSGSRPTSEDSIPLWQRWNDYGIALLRKGNGGADRGELRQARQAFGMVEELGRPDGPINLARVYLREGLTNDAAEALNRAAAFDPPAPDWTHLWFSGLVSMQNAYLDEAIDAFSRLAALDTAETREREFDFGQDYRVWNELGLALFERSKQERGEANKAERERFLGEAIAAFESVLEIEPENQTAHYNLSLIYDRLDDAEKSAHHQVLHQTYRVDDNARDRAIAAARKRYPAADHAANAIVFYDLQRPGAPELPTEAAVERDQ